MIKTDCLPGQGWLLQGAGPGRRAARSPAGHHGPPQDGLLLLDEFVIEFSSRMAVVNSYEYLSGRLNRGIAIKTRPVRLNVRSHSQITKQSTSGSTYFSWHSTLKFFSLSGGRNIFKAQEFWYLGLAAYQMPRLRAGSRRFCQTLVCIIARQTTTKTGLANQTLRLTQ